MLYLYYGWDKEPNLSVDGYFKNNYMPEWLDIQIVKDMIQDIDKSTVRSRECIDSPYLGQIPPERLSGGVKALMLMMYDDDFYTDLIVIGNNCSKWLGEISKTRDIRACITGYHLDYIGVPLICVNTGELIDTKEKWDKAYHLLDDIKELL